MAVTKLVERCFISDLALVSSPEVACGFRYDQNHCVISSFRAMTNVACNGRFSDLGLKQIDDTFLFTGLCFLTCHPSGLLLNSRNFGWPKIW